MTYLVDLFMTFLLILFSEFCLWSGLEKIENGDVIKHPRRHWQSCQEIVSVNLDLVDEACINCANEATSYRMYRYTYAMSLPLIE